MNLHKLKKATLHELRVRATQRVTAFSERRGWSSLVKLPRDDEFSRLLSLQQNTQTYDLLRCFKSRSEPVFFISFESPDETVVELKTRWPQSAPRIIEKADRICDGQFELLGFKELSFGSPIDWHFEPTTGKRIPLLHWSKLDYLDADVAGDKKIIWELNRHQYFSTLGQAYWLTRDERYARTFRKHLEAWMDSNPPKLGINWASSLEVAFRSMSWLFAFYFFRWSASLQPETFTRAWKFLYLSARHLESYLSTYFSPNTHLTGEALGLFYLGTFLPEFKEAKRWQELGSRILIEQLPVHVKGDGVYFEHSSYYHRYTSDLYIHFLILSRANGLTLPNQVEKALLHLLDHLMYITRPDGTTPFFGDDDGGRLVMLDTRPVNDFRGTLATGAALFMRGDYKFVAEDAAEELLWLLGAKALRNFDSIDAHEPAEQSQAFFNSGYFVMRDGWNRYSNYMLFDCGPHGALNCGHAHADALSIEVAANGQAIVVDPGTFTYTGSQEMRNRFRSSQAHSTLVVDDQSSSVPGGPFSWQSVARCKLVRWISSERFDYVSGHHDGYERLEDPVTVSRSILFLKHDYWIVRDELKCSKLHNAELKFQLNSTSRANMEDVRSRQFMRELSSGFEIHCFATGEGRSALENGWVSKCYGERELAPTYSFSVQVNGCKQVISFLLPSKPSQPRQIYEIEAVGGRAFAVSDKTGIDIVMIRSADHLECASLVTDFEWIWARFAVAEKSRVDRLVALNGTALTVNGGDVLNRGEQIEYLDVLRIGETLKVESNSSRVHNEVSFKPFDEGRFPVSDIDLA